MTEQMFLFRCRDVRKYAFDYRQGDLPSDDVRKMEKHLDACEACREYLDRLEGMLDASATFDFAGGLDADAVFANVQQELASERSGPGETLKMDKDALFERITGELQAVANPEQSTSAEHESHSEPVVVTPNIIPAEPAANDDLAKPSRTRLYVALALAAGIAIGFALPRLLHIGGEPPENVVERTPEGTSDATPQRDDDPTTFELADLSIEPTPSDIDDVRVYGTPTANWKIRRQGSRKRMQLEAGTVLVEFVPRGDASLQFVADGFTVNVTGTVFYVSSDDGVVGVVTGAVEVETEGGEAVTLTDGEEWSIVHGRRKPKAASVKEATRFVDPIEHRRQLGEAQRKPAPAKQPADQRMNAPRPPVSKEVAQAPRSALRDSADQALRDGRHAVAAQYYERMVEEFSAADPSNASLRLDLARIYINHLDSPARAATHLRRFVEDRPDDPATPSAKDELCRIVSKSGQIEPLCDF